MQAPAQTATQTPTEQLLAKSEISLWIDTYDDIFSDFDPRPFSQRALSVDFIEEAKRAARDKETGQAILHFLAPASIRGQQKEASIKKRLKEHFKRHADLLESETKGQVRNGIIITILGFSLAALAAAIAFYFSTTFIAELLVVILEPAGWFTLWHGMDMAIFEKREKDPDLRFYKKMADAEIIFDSY